MDNHPGGSALATAVLFEDLTGQGPQPELGVDRLPLIVPLIRD